MLFFSWFTFVFSIKRRQMIAFFYFRQLSTADRNPCFHNGFDSGVVRGFKQVIYIFYLSARQRYPYDLQFFIPSRTRMTWHWHVYQKIQGVFAEMVQYRGTGMIYRLVVLSASPPHSLCAQPRCGILCLRLCSPPHMTHQPSK